MKKLICFFLSACLLVLPCFAVEYSSLEDLVNDVNEVIPPYDYSQDYVGVDSPVDPVIDTYEVGPIDYTAVAINELIDVLAQTTTTSSFNMEAAQMLYLRAICVSNPFMDYVVTYDGNQTYGLYYGYRLQAGKTANYAYVTRTQIGNQYYYQYNTGLSASVPSSNVYVSSIDKSLPNFSEVENVKANTFIEICLCVALGLWIVSKILFR